MEATQMTKKITLSMAALVALVLPTAPAFADVPVEWGKANRNLDGITAIGVDELSWKKGHKYLTLVYQLDTGCRRLLWIGRNRKSETFAAFFD
jgi:transposase